MQERGYIGLSQITIDALEQQRMYGKKQLTTDQLLAKIQKDILAREKQLTKEKSAQAAFDQKKADLQSMFEELIVINATLCTLKVDLVEGL
jgi:hypothetical protein